MTGIRAAGYLRIGSEMLEALFARPLTLTQVKIVLELLRRLHEQRRALGCRPWRSPNPHQWRTVRVSHRELAAAVHARSLRSFREAMKDLERWRILIVAEPARGRRSPAYRVVRDVTRWALPAGVLPHNAGVGQGRSAP